ncbi:hypothetical protein PVAND_004771 [Polypedilum vanderplanki]|uniref:Uncharacterized protein n=1 Tax=Polypedilum vanderplanki TaxID=319348 RepID=A0A9J6BYR6_POLVA|nr:hypothetical protein PVAND_004771 [Polypedilum vanderplanki]
MQNSPCPNKNSTIASCCCDNRNKSNEVQVIKPECLVLNIKAAQQVCFNDSMKNQRPKTANNVMQSQNKQQHQQQNFRPKTVQPEIKVDFMTCDEYMKHINGKPKQENCCQKKKNRSKSPKKEPMKPKNAEEEKFLKEMEEDRWKTTYQTAFTWKTLRNDKLKK